MLVRLVQQMHQVNQQVSKVSQQEEPRRTNNFYCSKVDRQIVIFLSYHVSSCLVLVLVLVQESWSRLVSAYLTKYASEANEPEGRLSEQAAK